MKCVLLRIPVKLTWDVADSARPEGLGATNVPRGLHCMVFGGQTGSSILEWWRTAGAKKAIWEHLQAMCRTPGQWPAGEGSRRRQVDAQQQRLRHCLRQLSGELGSRDLILRWQRRLCRGVAAAAAAAAAQIVGKLYR